MSLLYTYMGIALNRHLSEGVYSNSLPRISVFFIILTQELLKELLDYNPQTGIFTRKVKTATNINVWDIAGYIDKKDLYVRIRLWNKNYFAHRLAFLYEYWRMPSIIDHINWIRNDNRISNIREVTQRENCQNMKKRPRNDMSLPTWVYEFKYKWKIVAYNARFIDINWTLCYSSLFNIKKCWWKTNALLLAVEYRNKKINELVSKWALYTNRHWK